ncbi:MAG: C40 family peptidase [Eubacterium sp.]|nr:C40 family peptidase [Eubacterium sp.]MBR1772609.1 C40 family peptidase [Eubacterium sp.]
MYKPTKRVLAACLAAGMLLTVVGVRSDVQAGQDYDSSNVGISVKVGEYLEGNGAEDPVSDLTDGSVTMADVYAEPTATDAEPEVDLQAKTASLTNAEIFPQFQDRAVATTEGKVNIRVASSTDAEVIGALDRGGVCLVDEVGDEWSLIESGTCVGYIANEYLAYGDDAGQWCLDNGIVRSGVVNTATLKVRADKDENSECLTLIPEGEEYYVYSQGDEWTEIAVDDDIRGFVKSEYIDVSFNNPRAISVEEQAEMDRIAKEEADRAWLEYLAQQAALQQQAAAPQGGGGTRRQATYTATQTTGGGGGGGTAAAAPAPTYAAPAGSGGSDLVNYANQFVGNSYKWGGTSLTNGADCSGFVQSVYANYGYSLPRTAAQQSGAGTEVSLSDIQAGDLLFYSNGGDIGHVAIYEGNGTIVHASNSRDGIKTSSYDYRTPVKAVRVIGQ